MATQKRAPGEGPAYTSGPGSAHPSGVVLRETPPPPDLRAAGNAPGARRTVRESAGRAQRVRVCVCAGVVHAGVLRVLQRALYPSRRLSFVSAREGDRGGTTEPRCCASVCSPWAACCDRATSVPTRWPKDKDRLACRTDGSSFRAFNHSHYRGRKAQAQHRRFRGSRVRNGYQVNSGNA